MHLTRRDFMRSTLLACGASVPVFLARSALAMGDRSAKAGKDRVLVVLQLDGGNDGLNTVVPYRDDNYFKHRPRLHLTKDRLHKIDDHIGLNPGLQGLAKLLEDRQLAIVQSVGYPNPNRSHFESMAIWQSARLKPTDDTPGWLARSVDQRPPAPGTDVPALHISDAGLPQALAGSQHHVPSLINLEQFRRRIGLSEPAGAQAQRLALDQLAGQGHGAPGSLLEFVERSTVITYASSARLEGFLNGRAAQAGYPELGLAQRLKLIAQLIKAGLTTSIYYTQLGGFDTHANQQGIHEFLLREVGDSLKAFLDDVNKAGEGKRVLVLVFSEFGRRLEENASAGTDHGTAAPVFLLGKSVKPGAHGPYPNLQDLADGDPKHAIDFRQIYATLLDQWLDCPSQMVLGEKFTPLRVLYGC
jgi:uncharacterized protein (DUF1501 family)